MNPVENEKVIIPNSVIESGLRAWVTNFDKVNVLLKGKNLYILIGSSVHTLEDILLANKTILGYILDVNESKIYLDYGYNKERLTKELFNNLLNL